MSKEFFNRQQRGTTACDEQTLVTFRECRQYAVLDIFGSSARILVGGKNLLFWGNALAIKKLFVVANVVQLPLGFCLCIPWFLVKVFLGCPTQQALDRELAVSEALAKCIIDQLGFTQEPPGIMPEEDRKGTSSGYGSKASIAWLGKNHLPRANIPCMKELDKQHI